MSSKTQVLLATYFGFEQGGGVATATAMIAAELYRRGFSVKIAAVQDFNLPNIPTILLPSIRQNPHLAARDRLLTAALTQIIKKNKIDLVHATDDRYVGVAAIQAARLCGVPVIQDFRDYWFCCLKGDLLFRNCELCSGMRLAKCAQCLSPIKIPWTVYKYHHWQKKLQILSAADLFLPVSQCVAQQMKLFGLDPKKTLVAYDTLPDFDDQGRDFSFSKIKKLVNQYQLQNKTIVLFAGRLIYHRGLKTLLETALLLQKINPRIHFLIAGTGELKNSIQSFIQKNNLTNLTLLGLVPAAQMSNFYELADLVFFPSQFHEPFSRSVLEALFYELPIVASNLGGLTELIKNGRNGFLINPRDPVEAAKKINQLAQNPRLQIQMSAANHLRRANFARRQYFDRLTKHYRQLIKNRPVIKINSEV